MNHYEAGEALGPTMQQMSAAWSDYSAVCAGIPPPSLSAHMPNVAGGPGVMPVSVGGHPGWSSIYSVNNNVPEACGHQTVLPGPNHGGGGALLSATGLADLPPGSVNGPMSPYAASSHSAAATPVSAAPGPLDCGGLGIQPVGKGKVGRKAPSAAAKRRRAAAGAGNHVRPPSRSSSLLSNGEDGASGVASLAAAVAAASGNGPASGSHKSCVVCSDHAVNNNFGQITCESCKAFFRRNAHKMEVS